MRENYTRARARERVPTRKNRGEPGRYSVDAGDAGSPHVPGAERKIETWRMFRRGVPCDGEIARKIDRGDHAEESTRGS